VCHNEGLTVSAPCGARDRLTADRELLEIPQLVVVVGTKSYVQPLVTTEVGTPVERWPRLS
jgi:hypothetical protein